VEKSVTERISKTELREKNPTKEERGSRENNNGLGGKIYRGEKGS